MLKKIVDNRNYIILGIIVILLILITINFLNKEKEQTKSFNYFSENITIKLYNNKNMALTFKKTDDIYQTYNEFYKNPNKNTDKNLLELLKYGKELYRETNGLIDISSGKLLKSIEEDKEYNFKTNIDNLNTKDKNTLTNINIDSIIGSYATNKVKEYLEENGITKYIINEDGNIIAGKYYNEGKYAVSINKNESDVIDIVYLENESMAIKGNTKTFKPYMVNPITSKKNEENKIVAVIAKDLNTANMLGNTLYLMSLEEGQNFIKQYDAEAMWYTKDDKTVTTDGFKKYLKKD